MTEDILIGFKINPRIYLTIDGDDEATMFELNQILDVSEKDGWSIISYQDNSGFVVEYTVKEKYNSILHNITKAKCLKKKCVEYIKDLTDFEN